MFGSTACACPANNRMTGRRQAFAFEAVRAMEIGFILIVCAIRIQGQPDANEAPALHQSQRCLISPQLANAWRERHGFDAENKRTDIHAVFQIEKLVLRQFTRILPLTNKPMRWRVARKTGRRNASAPRWFVKFIIPQFTAKPSRRHPFCLAKADKVATVNGK